MAIIAGIYIRRKHKKMDAIWKVDKSELIFDNPPRELGQGTFGVVLLAEYRGTAVAVKKVLPVSAAKADWSNSRGSSGKKSKSNFGTATEDTTKISGGDIEIGLQSTFALPRGSVGRGSVGRGSVGRGSVGRGSVFNLFGTGASMKRIKRDFIKEMRTLSKLRHPCSKF